MSGQASTYQVLNRQAPKLATDGIVRGIAEAIRSGVAAQEVRGRTGNLGGGWRIERIKPGVYRVLNEVPYGKYVEYGTRFMPARPVFGRVISQYRARVSR
jgi:hypothetical protein